jgi:hypothetical protein
MAAFESSTIISRSRDLLATDVDGEIILMSLERGLYYGLDGTARRIWDLLEVPMKFGDLCSVLEEKYIAPRAVIEADIQKFVTEMFDESIVTLS